MALGRRHGIAAWLASLPVMLAVHGCTSPAATAVAVKPPADVAVRHNDGGVAWRPKSASNAPLDLGPRDRQYLLHLATGPIEIRVRGSHATRALVPRARASLYDAGLELVWFLDRDRLGVVDLRARDLGPVTVAVGVPEDIFRLWIEHPTGAIRTDDGCDGEEITVRWEPRPAVRLAHSPQTEVRIENEAWLDAQRTRASRVQPEPREFESERVKLPRQMRECDERERCGTTVAFGSLPLQLVLAAEQRGDDCMHRACLLRDPATGLFAQPPAASVWAKARDAATGPCGPFRFDATGASFLLGTQLCARGTACVELVGQALGWLVPGDIVGLP